MSIKRKRIHRKRKKENTDTHNEYSFNVIILHSFWKWMHDKLLTKYERHFLELAILIVLLLAINILILKIHY